MRSSANANTLFDVLCDGPTGGDYVGMLESQSCYRGKSSLLREICRPHASSRSVRCGEKSSPETMSGFYIFWHSENLNVHYCYHYFCHWRYRIVAGREEHGDMTRALGCVWMERPSPPVGECLV